MSKSPGRILALLLACLIGFSPARAAWQGLASASVASEEARSASHHSMDGRHAAGPSAPACQHCKAADCCGGSHCLAGHCAVCVAMLPVTLRLPPVAGASTRAEFSPMMPLSGIVFPLYRPPRG